MNGLKQIQAVGSGPDSWFLIGLDERGDVRYGLPQGRGRITRTQMEEGPLAKPACGPVGPARWGT